MNYGSRRVNALLTFLRLRYCQRLIDLVHRLRHAPQTRLPAEVWQRKSAHVGEQLFAALAQKIKIGFLGDEMRDAPDIRIRNARPALQAPPMVKTRRSPAVACVSESPCGIVCGSE